MTYNVNNTISLIICVINFYFYNKNNNTLFLTTIPTNCMLIILRTF